MTLTAPDPRPPDPHLPDTSTLAAAFAERTGYAPEGIWGAPGRVNLIGEHLDYNDCHVLPLAIDRVAAVAVGTRRDGVVRCWSMQEPVAVETTLEDLAGAHGWTAYLCGVLWALQEAGVAVPGLDVVLDSAVPAGSGMSSSAALECATALAVDELTGAGLSRSALAALCRRGENEIVGVPVGVMDQSASMHGEDGAAVFLDCRSGAIEMLPLDLDRAGLSLVVVDSGTRHRLADGAYGDRRDSCRRAAALIGVPALRDATLEDLGALAGDATLVRRARHVLTEEARVLAAAAFLRSGDLAALGPLLVASHASLRDDFEISTPELDAIVAAAVGAGALGARLMGGGFGGSAIALVPVGAFDDVHAAVGAVLDSVVDPVVDPAEAGPGAAPSPVPGPQPGPVTVVHQPRVEQVRPATGARRLA